MAEIKQKSLKLNAFFNILKTCISLLMPLITFPYSSRILQPDGIGKVNFCQSISTYFSLIAGLGIATYAVREGAKVRDNKTELSKFTKEILIINLISTLVAYILLFLSLIFIPKFQEYKWLIAIVSSSIFFGTIGLDWYFSAVEEYGYVTLRTIIFQIISVVLLFTFVRSKDDIYMYAGLNIFGAVGTSIWNLIILSKRIEWKNSGKLELKKHLKPIFLLFSLTLISSVYTILDTSMLGFLADDESVGFYTASTKINKMVLTAVTAGAAILLPRLSYNAEHNKEEFLPLFKKSLKITLLFAIPATVGLNILAEPILLLFSGKSYLPAVNVTKIMNPIIIIISLSGLIGMQYFVPLKKEKFTVISVAIGAVTNFSLNFILIPKYHAIGAALATLIAESSVTLTQLIIAGKKIWDKSVFINILQIIISSTVMGFAVYFISKLFNSIIVSILISIILGIIVYFTCLLLLKNESLFYFINSLKNKISGGKKSE